ncbi:MAG: FtsX-like permease family protein [Bryobacteraceae bacterium]
MTALHRKLFRDLIHLRGQVMAVTMVLACGIATYVTMRTAYYSLVVTQEDYYAAYRFADVFANAKRAPESLKPLIQAVPGVAAVETRVVMDVTADVPGLEEPASARIVSIPSRNLSNSHNDPLLNLLFLREGRMPERADEALISESFATANQLHTGDSLSVVLNGRWERLRIAGVALSPEYVYEVRPGEVFPDNRRFGILWMSRDAIAPALNMEGAFNDVALSLTRDANEKDVIARLDQLLDRYGSLGAYGREDQISARIVNDHIEEIRTSGLILPTIFLGIVAFLLHVLMSRLVATQRGQIAVLKAFGYRNSEIGWHYIQLALVAVIAGTIVGIGLGLWLGTGLTALFGRYFLFPSLTLHVNIGVLLTSAGISGAAACLGALRAVGRAVALAPAEAMRPEPPARFEPGILETSGLRIFFSPAARMIVRNLDRRRTRATLSALAIGLSVAILVVAWYRMDAIDQLADVEFSHVHREDALITFHEPLSPGAAHEVARLPGVLRVEPFREVPARLRFGNHWRRTSILGLADNAELRRPLDERLHPVGVPADGLMLNTKLAEILGVRVGDRVRIEVLEGERPVRDVVVAKLVDEPVGLGAYMDPTALHRLMREGDSISGAYIRVDAASASKLYSVLKRMPTVMGVAVTEATVASFWKTIGDSINSTTVILVSFACVIAFGIVYNGARIALSERGNELASLRVLGYTKFEIGRILLGEQALLTTAAIPPGIVMGYGLALWVAKTHSQDLVRLPFVVTTWTCGIAAVVVMIAAVVSGMVVARRLQRMDLTEVLKSRE